MLVSFGHWALGSGVLSFCFSFHLFPCGFKTSLLISTLGFFFHLGDRGKASDRWIGRGANTVVGLLLFLFLFYVAVFAEPFFLNLLVELSSHYLPFRIPFVWYHYILQTFPFIILSWYACTLHQIFICLSIFTGAWLVVRGWGVLPKSEMVNALFLFSVDSYPTLCVLCAFLFSVHILFDSAVNLRLRGYHYS